MDIDANLQTNKVGPHLKAKSALSWHSLIPGTPKLVTICSLFNCDRWPQPIEEINCRSSQWSTNKTISDSFRYDLFWNGQSPKRSQSLTKKEVAMMTVYGWVWQCMILEEGISLACLVRDTCFVEEGRSSFRRRFDARNTVGRPYATFEDKRPHTHAKGFSSFLGLILDLTIKAPK